MKYKIYILIIKQLLMKSNYDTKINRKEMIKMLNSKNNINNENKNIKNSMKNKKVNQKNNIQKKNVKQNNEIKEINNTNNYYDMVNNKKEEEENDKKIKEIEKEIKNKREKDLKNVEIFENPKNKELLKLEIKVLRKLYGDLFIRIPNTFKINHLTFENFVYEFGKEIHELFEFDKNNPSYDNLIREVNILILKKYPISPDLTKFNRKELNKYFYELGINDDWALIERYKAEMDKKEEKERLMKIAQSMKDYYRMLDEQIEQKKNLEKIEEDKKNEEKIKKMKEMEKIKLKNQKKIEQLQKNEKLLQMLNKEKIEQINENEKIKQYYLKNMEEENKNINENNYNLIKFKLDNAMAIQTRQMDNYNQKFEYQPKIVLNTGYSIPDDQISAMVDQIMLKKKQQNKYNFLNIDNELNEDNENDNNYELNKNNNIIIDNNEELSDVKNIEGINLEIENKVNKILAKEKYKIK